VSAVCACSSPIVVPAEGNTGAYCSACGYWWDKRYGSQDPVGEFQGRRVLLPNASTAEIERELVRRGLKKRQGQFQAAHGKRVAQQKQKAKNRAKRRNK
jgi:hypothetical protein